MKAISLFSCGGIGDLALRKNNIHVLVANELIYERAQVFSYNFPKTQMLIGDIWQQKEAIIQSTQQLLNNEKLDIVFATPPCQGMSKNGRGKLLNAIRKGEKPKLDVRNRLVIPAVEIFIQLGADTLIMENVPEMQNTLISKNNNKTELVSIPDYICEQLGTEFIRSMKVVEFANYGVPQRRQRLISIYTRNKKLKLAFFNSGTLFPKETHAKNNPTKASWITVRQAIAHLPKLDAKNKEFATNQALDYHKVPLLDEDKYLWVSNTPRGKSAFDNQCINPVCLCQDNPVHGSSHNEEGINKANDTTPLYCLKCGELLPRPWVKTDQGYRLMKGYTSAYKRMNFDLPASTLTRNLSYACSDNKVHPEQNRVLSLYEAMILHTLNEYRFSWQRTDGKKTSDKLIRELIGESIPPKGLDIILKHIVALMNSKSPLKPASEQGQSSLEMFT